MSYAIALKPSEPAHWRPKLALAGFKTIQSKRWTPGAGRGMLPERQPSNTPAAQQTAPWNADMERRHLTSNQIAVL
ncbi:MAG: hypothetical protein ACKN9T_00410, partial [Candidatus Methylumidiphilus sp.]